MSFSKINYVCIHIGNKSMVCIGYLLNLTTGTNIHKYLWMMFMFWIAVMHMLTQQPPFQGLGTVCWVLLIYLYAFCYINFQAY